MEYTDDYFFNIIRKIDNGEYVLDNNDTYEIKADMLQQLIKQLLNRQPLKMCTEWQKFVPIEQANITPDHLHPLFRRECAKKAGIENEWCIPFEIDIKISDTNPYMSLSEASNLSKKDTYQTIRIIKKQDGQEKVVPLVEDETSIIHVLSQHVLKIKRVYTKNDGYKQKYLIAESQLKL